MKLSRSYHFHIKALFKFTTPSTTPFTTPLLHHFGIKIYKFLKIFIKFKKSRKHFKIKEKSKFPTTHTESAGKHNNLSNLQLKILIFSFKINGFRNHYTITTPLLHHQDILVLNGIMLFSLLIFAIFSMSSAAFSSVT